MRSDGMKSMEEPASLILKNVFPLCLYAFAFRAASRIAFWLKGTLLFKMSVLIGETGAWPAWN